MGVHLFRLGVETAFVGAVGDDEYGRRVIEKLAAEGLDTSHIQVLHGETAVSEVEFVDNERVFGDYHDGVMLDFKLSPADIDFLCTYDLVHSAMWGMVHDDLHLIRERGVPVSFDFADKLEDNPVTEVAIENCDYAIFSYTEDDTYIRDYLTTCVACMRVAPRSRLPRSAATGPSPSTASVSSPAASCLSRWSTPWVPATPT